ncbi:MAG: glycosyltransferase family 87 protein [Candidatus Limnocylindria bacterium]
MEEAVAAFARARWPAARGLPARWVLRFAPALVVVGTASAFTFAGVASGLTIDYLGWDSRAYYDALRSSAPYAGAEVGLIGSFLYPPPFLQVLAPSGQLPWPVFMFGWTAVLAAAAVALLRRVPRQYRSMLPLFVVLAGADIWAGNVNLLLAYGAVVGLSLPAAWAGLALTKVTPGVGALWLAFRGRWPEFGFALAVTVAGAAVSFVAAPQLWGDWLAMVFSEDAGGGYAASVPVPLFVRLPLAVVVLWWAARSDRAWLVPCACLLALPVIWFNGLSLLLGAAALLEARPAPASSPAPTGAEPVPAA